MNTVTFEDYNDPKIVYNSFEHLGLYLSSKSIGAATPKILTVDIPFGDGELDYTEFFGSVKYNNRSLSFSFSVVSDRREFLKKYSLIQNLLNGRKMKITLSDDSDFYYVGRVTVNEWETDKSIGKIVIDVNASPYKLKHATTVIYTAVSTTTHINCPNLKMVVVPKITLSDIKCTVTGADLFKEGDNIVTITPKSGATLPIMVTIEYQEGSL